MSINDKLTLIINTRNMAKYHLFLLTLILILLNPTVTLSQTTLEEIINDMKLEHEGRPHGVPDSYDWAWGPRIGIQSPPSGWNAVMAWGQVYEWINGNPASNTRVQIKDLELHYLSKTDHKWHLLQKELVVDGAAYVEDYVDDVNIPADIRVEPDGSISVTAGGGYNFHFWPYTGRVNFPVDDIEGCFVTLKARLILDDSTGTDDRADAKFVLNVGGDWWQSLTAEWDQWTTNADIGHGRFRFVTSEWKSYNMHSVLEDTIRNNPPPFELATSSGMLHSYNEFEELQIFPNPTKEYFNIRLLLNQSGNVKIDTYNLNGTMVETLMNGFLNADEHLINVSAYNYNPGLYILKIETEEKALTNKLVILD